MSKVGKLAIDKEMFVEILVNIQKQHKHDEICSKAFETIFLDGYIGSYNNSYLHSSLLYLLKKAFNDNHADSWIDYFIYDLDFGKKYKDGCATYKDKSNINLSSSSTLYDFLMDYNN